MRPAALLLAALLALAGCRPSPDVPALATASPSPSPMPSPVINPPGVVVTNDAFARSERKVRTSMAELKDLDVWRKLTKHLYKVKFGSRLGASNIPEDGHLADVHLTAAIDEEAQGRLCDIRFYPNAIKRDLGRWRLYYSQGLMAEAPPSLRDFWTAVMAHELGHCFPGGRGEKFAEKWEGRVLRLLQD
jgi:hypothetical protein